MGKAALTKVFVNHYPQPIMTLEELTEKYFTHYHTQIKSIKSSYQYLWQFYVLLKKEDIANLAKIGIDKGLIRNVIEGLLRGEYRTLVNMRAKIVEKIAGTTPSESARDEALKEVSIADPKEIPNIINRIDEILKRWSDEKQGS